MTPLCTLQLYATGFWQDVASVRLLGDVRQGWRTTSYTGYDVTWAFEHMNARDAHALSCRFPVGLEPTQLSHWPVFLIDMLPQGFGRRELLHRLGLPETSEAPSDWPLLLGGAGNSIGNLRVKEAAQWLQQHCGPEHGFTDEEVGLRADQFAEYLAAHGLFLAGSSGVQGEWPKLLLTRADDGLLYLDHSLPDERAREHFIVKFGRGHNERLAQILRHEAVYMALAQRLGLRVHAPLILRQRALFIPRFDRRIYSGGVERLGQESIASLTGKVGFESVPSHDEVCRQLVLRCTDPQTEVLEYLRRDVANLALGNKDNHARNTAIQRDFSGHIALTPLYDFAPMYLHPDGIARRIRWKDNDGVHIDWAKVLDTVCQPILEGKRYPQLDREELANGLRAMAPALHDIAINGMALGIEADVHQHLRPGLEKLARDMEALR
jgi:serine/threonine-protein kinase HipA